MSDPEELVHSAFGTNDIYNTLVPFAMIYQSGKQNRVRLCVLLEYFYGFMMQHRYHVSLLLEFTLFGYATHKSRVT